MSDRLSRRTIGALPASIERPSYDLERITTGIVHFGPGAFHRAHQAPYFDAILATDPRWGISEVALNSTGVANALRPQDGLYTLALLADEPRYRVIGSVSELLLPAQHAQILSRIASPETHLITATVTEKGYCLSTGGTLDFDHPGIQADVRNPDAPRTFIGWLAQGLSHRRRHGSGGLTVVSCDNLSGNGMRLGRAVHAFARAVENGLADWIEDRVRFPNTMVDSITPASDDTLRSRVLCALGVEDAWPIQRETFTQWAIEDDFAGARPPLDRVGVQFVKSVSAFEDAKLRLLNGAHSSLAYLGLLLGYETVGDAMDDRLLAGFVERMMREDIAVTIPSLEGVPISDYITTILDRFRNRAVRHLLSQIAWDGSQKLPFRLLVTIEARRRAGLPVGRLAVPVAAWLRFLALPRTVSDPLVDPLRTVLVPLARTSTVDSLLDLRAVFPQYLAEDDAFRNAVRDAHAMLADRSRVDELLRHSLA